MSTLSRDKKTQVEYEIDDELVQQGEVSSAPAPTLAWGRFVKAVQVQDPGNLTMREMFLYNHDLKPVERARRLWLWFNFVFFWIADSFNINTWQIAGTGVQEGMTWWQVWLSVWLGYFIALTFVVITARIGAYYHISFPVVCRLLFGVYGLMWPVLNRVVMACVWYSVQGWLMGECVQLMLMSIFGNDLNTRIPDHILSPNATTFQFMSFFLAWLFLLPALWFAPHQIRHLFTVKAYVVPVAGIGFLIWTLVRADGIGPVIHAKATISGLDLGWAFVRSTMDGVANFATLIVNAPDFSRFADTPTAAIYSQWIGIPVCFSITALIGILVSSSSQLMFGEIYWLPLDVLLRYLDHFTSGNRAGVFFIAAAFALAQLGTNISANSLSAGTDMTALLPRFINIRRGSYICAAVGLCICPWNLLSSGSMFTTYLSAYLVFLSLIAGVVAGDYYFVRRGKLVLEDLYSGDKRATYTYNRIGLNWRAYAAYIGGILPNIVGFVGATKTHKVPAGATYVYNLNFFAGFILAFVVYSGLTWFFPVAGMPELEGPFAKGWFEKWQEVEDFDELFAQVNKERDLAVEY